VETGATLTASAYSRSSKVLRARPKIAAAFWASRRDGSAARMPQLFPDGP
jgi:hypothetical protein